MTAMTNYSSYKDNEDTTNDDSSVSRKGVSSLYGDLLDIAPPSTVISQDAVKYEPSSTALKFQPSQTVRKRKAEKSKKSVKVNFAPVVEQPAKTFVPGSVFGFSNNLDIADEYWDGEYDSNEPNSLQTYLNSKEHEAEQLDWKEYLAMVRRTGVPEESDMYHGLDVEKVEDHQEDKGDEHAESTVEDNTARKFQSANLLRKYGWKPGHGLGKSRIGISKPLRVRRSIKRPGLSYFAGKPATTTVSRVVVVKHETHDVADQMLPTKLGEKYDCYGEIEVIKASNSGIFIRFLQTESAVRMVREVKDSRLYDEKLFENGDYNGNDGRRQRYVDGDEN